MSVRQGECRTWCTNPCQDLQGNAGEECGGCTGTYLCQPGADGFPTVLLPGVAGTSSSASNALAINAVGGVARFPVAGDHSTEQIAQAIEASTNRAPLSEAFNFLAALVPPPDAIPGVTSCRRNVTARKYLFGSTAAGRMGGFAVECNGTQPTLHACSEDAPGPASDELSQKAQDACVGTGGTGPRECGPAAHMYRDNGENPWLGPQDIEDPAVDCVLHRHRETYGSLGLPLQDVLQVATSGTATEASGTTGTEPSGTGTEPSGTGTKAQPIGAQGQAVRPVMDYAGCGRWEKVHAAVWRSMPIILRGCTSPGATEAAIRPKALSPLLLSPVGCSHPSPKLATSPVAPSLLEASPLCKTARRMR